VFCVALCVCCASHHALTHSHSHTLSLCLSLPSGCPHKEIKSHETLAVSPSLLSTEHCTDGSHSSGYIAVAGAAGYVHLMDGKMKTWVGDVKLSSVRVPVLFVCVCMYNNIYNIYLCVCVCVFIPLD
jgi:hypothetical protein